MRTKRLAIGCLTTVILVALAIFPNLVSAHSPSGMDLAYNSDTDTLTVTVQHSVTDPNSHYIEKIEIYKNDVLEIERTYTSQESSSQKSDTFSVDAVDGDVLKATAICNIAGSITRDLTIGTTTTTTTTDGTDFFLITIIIAVVVIALGIVLVVVAIFRRR